MASENPFDLLTCAGMQEVRDATRLIEGELERVRADYELMKSRVGITAARFFARDRLDMLLDSIEGVGASDTEPRNVVASKIWGWDEDVAMQIVDLAGRPLVGWQNRLSALRNGDGVYLAGDKSTNVRVVGTNIVVTVKGKQIFVFSEEETLVYSYALDFFCGVCLDHIKGINVAEYESYLDHPMR